MRKIDYWELSMSFYPGILFGVRTYEDIHSTYVDHVLYLPFINFFIRIEYI